jgi:hypothetical protein
MFLVRKLCSYCFLVMAELIRLDKPNTEIVLLHWQTSLVYMNRMLVVMGGWWLYRVDMGHTPTVRAVTEPNQRRMVCMRRFRCLQ